MSKKLQLHIPTPCHEDWDNMNPVDKGRFCMSCQKKVIDFTGMSDEQLINYFKKPVASVCGRFEEGQLNRDIRMPQKKLLWMKYFFQFALPGFLVSMKAEAQKQRPATVAEINRNVEIKEKLQTNSLIKPLLNSIEGVVRDDNGAGLPGASIIIKGTKRGVATDNLGRFSIQTELPGEILTLVISYVGFQEQEKVIKLNQHNSNEILSVQLQPRVSGEVVVVAGFPVHRKGLVMGVTSIRCFKTIFKDSMVAPFSKFSIYPNPASQGQTITIENKKLPEDIYDIEFINIAGQTINKQQFFMGKNDKIYPRIPTTTAGVYFIKLIGSKSSKIYTEKIIVQ